MPRLQTILILATFGSCAFGAPIDINPYNEPDLSTFVTRPDIRPPNFNIHVYNHDSISPGYWFVSPYVDLKSRPKTSAFSPGQVGPHIYDGAGNLIYSGAHLVGGRTSFDFKAIEFNGSQHLSLLLDHDNAQSKFSAGAGVIFNSNYEVVSTVQNKRGSGMMNMHEFNVVDNGRRALTITYNPQMLDFSHDKGQGPYSYIGNNGFQETDLDTGEVTFDWWALDHIDWSDSFEEDPTKHGGGGVWDWFHMNSVDKTADGDYLISARYTNAIYKISGKDGSVIWRLGVISFLNNGANGHVKTTNTSSVMVISLDTINMKAVLLNQFYRPDGELTKLRGNGQKLPNGNFFICWSENGHISEHDAEGRVAMEAQFSSKRFVTYRAGKFNFTGYPAWPPVARAFSYGTTPQSATTAAYVSWNGATEVAKWKFWGSIHEKPRTYYSYLGEIDRSGFESIFVNKGFVPFIFAEAISASGKSLGFSAITKTETPGNKNLLHIVENSKKFKGYQRSKVKLTGDVDTKIGEDGEENDAPHHALKFIADLDTKLMESKRGPTLAIYLWLFTIASVICYLSIRRCRTQKQPWMKSEM